MPEIQKVSPQAQQVTNGVTRVNSAVAGHDQKLTSCSKR